MGSASIGFGIVKGIKVYDFGSFHYTEVTLSDDATNKTVAACNGIGKIIPTVVSIEAKREMVSTALAAYAAGKKVRLYSSTDTCNVDMIAIQETYF